MKIRILEPIKIGVVALLLFCCSCSKESLVDDSSQRVDVQIGVGVEANTQVTYAGIPGTPSENKVDRLRLFIFDASTGAMQENKYYDALSVPALGTFPFNQVYNLTVGQKRICAIGNEDPILKASLDAITDFDQLKPFTIANETTVNAVGALLPFCTIKTMTVLPNSSNNNLSLILHRSIGKLQIKIVKDAANMKTVELKSLQVVDIPTSSTLIEGFPLTAPARADLALQTFNQMIGLSIAQLNLTAPYLYEAFPTANYPSLRIILEVDAVLSLPVDIPIVSGIDAGGTAIKGIRRNTVANMTLTVLGDHIRVNYDIYPWNDETWIKDPSESDSNIEFGDWDLEPDYGQTLPGND